MRGGESKRARLVASHLTGSDMRGGTSSRVSLAALMIAACLALPGCGQKILEASNATINNGKIYRQGADEPFSGKATNIPEGTVIPYAAREQLLAQLRFMAANQVNQYWGPVGLCDVQLEKGTPEGTTTCKFAGTQLKRLTANFRRGALHGDFVMYAASRENAPIVSAKFDAGRLQGQQEVFSPTNGKRIWKGNWSAGVLDGPETAWSDATGNVILKANWHTGKLDGVVVRYAPDGKSVTYKATAVDGLLEGAEDEFYDDGRPMRHVEWAKGKKNGVEREWDRGQVTESDCADDFCTPRARPVAQTTQPPEDCLQGWITAFRKESGADAMISTDQTTEWTEWCKAGKQPPV